MHLDIKMAHDLPVNFAYSTAVLQRKEMHIMTIND